MRGAVRRRVGVPRDGVTYGIDLTSKNVRQWGRRALTLSENITVSKWMSPRCAAKMPHGWRRTKQGIPEVRSGVRPAAQNTEVPAVHTGSCRDRHRTARCEVTLAAPRSRSGFSIRQIGIPPCGADEVVKDVHHRGWGLNVREVPDAAEHFKSAIR